MDASFSKETGGSTHSVLQNLNGLAQVPFEGVLVEAYKGTRRKHNMEFRQNGHTTSQYHSMDSRFLLKLLFSAWNELAFAEAPSLAVFRSNFIRN